MKISTLSTALLTLLPAFTIAAPAVPGAGLDLRSHDETPKYNYGHVKQKATKTKTKATKSAKATKAAKTKASKTKGSKASKTKTPKAPISTGDSSSSGGTSPTYSSGGGGSSSSGNGTSSDGGSTGSTGSISGSGAATDTCTMGYCTMNGGTTGGSTGTVVTVTDYAGLVAAAGDDTAKIIMIEGTITGAQAAVPIGANKSILGKTGAKLEGFGLIIKATKNVIVRNLAISNVLAANGDALAINAATNVWIDHVEFSSNMQHDKDYYDGLLDATHAADFVTISNCYFHDHWKASLVGHSDSNGGEDTGKLHITYVNNYFKNINSRCPSFRFGTGHVVNNYYEQVALGINTRQGAQLLVEGNVFVDSKQPLYATDAGFAVVKDNDLGGGANTAGAGTLNTVPYEYTPLANTAVKAAVVGKAGATLSF